MISMKVAHWAYSQIEAAGGLTWSQNEKLVELEPGWDELFNHQPSTDSHQLS